MKCLVPSRFLVLLACASPAAAQIAPVGPFVGDAIEGFESQPAGGGVTCLSPRIFGNRADLCSLSGGPSLVTGAGYGNGLFAYRGQRLAGSTTEPAVILFDTPVYAFGGMIGTIANISGGTASFYDANNVLIGTQPITAHACEISCGWRWNAWTAGSGPRIQRIVFESPTSGGGGLAFDELIALYDSPFTGTHFCNADTNGGTWCPCSNWFGDVPRGCYGSAYVGGRLTAGGLPSLSNDTVVLRVEDVMPNSTTTVQFFQGTARVNGGIGVPFGDGLRCAGGTIVRVSTRTSQVGQAQYPGPGDPPLHVRGQVTAPGVRTYQVLYRDVGAFCTPATFNATNGYEITWAP